MTFAEPISEHPIEGAFRKQWADYVEDPDHVCITICDRMSRMVEHKAVANHLSLTERIRFATNDWDTATKFCTFVVGMGKSGLFDGVMSFLASKGFIIGVPRGEEVHHSQLPVKLHVSPAFHYTDTRLKDLLNLAKTAIYSGDPDEFPACLQGTRLGLIEEVVSRAIRPDRLHRLLLITGSAGTGKSALAASIEKALKDQRMPVFSFVCKHDDPERSNPKFVIPTLAWQLAREPIQRVGVEKALNSLEELFCDISMVTPSRQIELLTTAVSPAVANSPRPVLLVDGLDECGKAASRSQLLEAFVDNSETLCSRFTVILVSQPISQVEEHLRPSSLTVVDLDELLDSEDTATDLHRFLAAKLVVPLRRRGLDISSDQVARLVGAANGVFVWAQVACAYLTDLDDPADVEHALYELCMGKTPLSGSEFLYDLYRRTLHSSLVPGAGPLRKENVVLFRQIMAAVLFTEVPLSVTGIAWLAGRTTRAVEAHLALLRPLLAPRSSTNAFVGLLHASIDEFFRSLAPDDCWFVPTLNLEHALRCFDTMWSELSFNISGVENPFELASARTDLEHTRVAVSEPLRYACLHWHWHLSKVRRIDDNVVSALWRFFELPFLFWVEMVALFGRAHAALGYLMCLVSLTEGPLNEIALDAYQLLRHYRHHIELSSCHLYLSVLPLSHRQRILAKLYSSLLPENVLPIVGTGVETVWPSFLTLTHVTKVCSVDVSPIDGSILTMDDNGWLRMFDATTGGQIATLQHPAGGEAGKDIYWYTFGTRATYSSCGLKAVSRFSKSAVAIFWDVSTFKITRTVDLAWIACAEHLALVADTPIAVTLQASGGLHVWDLLTQGLPQELHVSDGEAIASVGYSLAVSRSGSFIGAVLGVFTVEMDT